MDLERLKRETTAAHEAVEHSLPLMDADLDLDRYTACLQRMAGIVGAWEAEATRVAPQSLRPLLDERRRLHLLHKDLHTFGTTPVVAPSRPVLPPMHTEPRLLGTMYVMEGSTLGGQLIARHLERTLGLAPGVGNSFFRSHAEHTGAMWRAFCGHLRFAVPESSAGETIEAAQQMFHVFGTWMAPPVKSRAQRVSSTPSAV